MTAPTGFRTPEVVLLTGLTYRQIDHYSSNGIVCPSIEDASGSGSRRRWSESDVVALRVVERLRAVGMSLGRIKDILDYLSTNGREPGCDVLAVGSVTIGWFRSSEEIENLYLAEGPCIALDVSRLWIEQK
jgi:DNA-binding transcriptional MerR regulator